MNPGLCILFQKVVLLKFQHANVALYLKDIHHVLSNLYTLSVSSLGYAKIIQRFHEERKKNVAFIQKYLMHWFLGESPYGSIQGSDTTNVK
jgi:hypothetical protein